MCFFQNGRVVRVARAWCESPFRLRGQGAFSSSDSSTAWPDPGTKNRFTTGNLIYIAHCTHSVTVNVNRSVWNRNYPNKHRTLHYVSNLTLRASITVIIWLAAETQRLSILFVYLGVSPLGDSVDRRTAESAVVQPAYFPRHKRRVRTNCSRPSPPKYFQLFQHT